MDYMSSQNYMEHNMFQNSNSFKCSSYIDSCKQYEFNQSACTIACSKKPKSSRIVTNVKKMRQAISKKLKKLINIAPTTTTANSNATVNPRTPVTLKLNQTATIRRSTFKSRTSLILSKSASSKRVQKSSETAENMRVQLVNYKYNGSSNYDLTMLPNTPRVVPKRLKYHRYSDGQHSTSSSSSSLASSNYSSYTRHGQAQDESEQFRSAEITHLFAASCASNCPVKSASAYYQQQLLLQQQQQQQIVSSFVSSQMQTSTPVQNKTRSLTKSSSTLSSKYSLSDETDSCAKPALFHDAESTFNVSPHDQSDDLIIVQTQQAMLTRSKTAYVNARVPPPVPSQVKIAQSHQLVKKAIHQTMSGSNESLKSGPNPNWNMLVINKFHDDTNATFNGLPEWAVGNELNLAVVNQLYYNPNGNGVFNKAV